MLTVLMATYNGASTLPDVLKEFTKLEPPDGGWKLIVVDNASTDQTKEIIASFQSSLPLMYLYESRRGKSLALNAGLTHVSGDLVVLTDDDVLPQPDWLQQLRLAADTQPAFSIFGGSILPKWAVPPKIWLNWVPLRPTYAIMDSEEGPIDPQLVFGPNMAIRADIFKNGYRFDETLGPKGSTYSMGEETELNLQLAKAGFKSWHCKSAVVYHMIRSSQMTQEWVLQKAAMFGRSQYRRDMKDVPISIYMLIRAYITLPYRILKQRVRLYVKKTSRSHEIIFRERWRLSYLKGRAQQARLMLKSR